MCYCLSTSETYYCLNASEMCYWLKGRCVTAWIKWRCVTAWLHVRCVTAWIQGKRVTAWLNWDVLLPDYKVDVSLSDYKGHALLPEPSCSVGFKENAKSEILTALLLTVQACLYLILCHWVSSCWHSEWSWNIRVQVKFFLDCLAELHIKWLSVTSEKFWIHELSKSFSVTCQYLEPQ
jgi:hypothetical protein